MFTCVLYDIVLVVELIIKSDTTNNTPEITQAFP